MFLFREYFELNEYIEILLQLTFIVDIVLEGNVGSVRPVTVELTDDGSSRRRTP